MNSYLLNIRHLIENKEGLSIERLASEIGTTRVTLSKYLNSKTQMPIETLLKICKVLDVRPCEILEKDFKHGQEFSNFPKTEPKIKIGGEKIGGYLHGEKEALYENQVGFLQNQLKEKDKQINDLIQVIGGQTTSKEAV